MKSKLPPVSSGTLPMPLMYIRTGSLVGALRSSRPPLSVVPRGASRPPPSDLHDFEAFLAEVVLDVGQVILGLLGGKIRGKLLEKFLGGYEANRAPGHVPRWPPSPRFRLIGSWSAATGVSAVSRTAEDLFKDAYYSSSTA